MHFHFRPLPLFTPPLPPLACRPFPCFPLPPLARCSFLCIPRKSFFMRPSTTLKTPLTPGGRLTFFPVPFLLTTYVTSLFSFPKPAFLYILKETNSIEIFSWVKQPVSFVFAAPQMWQHTSSAEPSSPSQKCPLCWQPLLLSSWPAPFFSTSWKETAELIHSEIHRLLRKAPRATSVLPFSSSWPWPQQLVWLAEHWSPSIFLCIPPPSPWWPAPASSGVSVHHRGTTPVLPTARQRWRTWNGIHKVLFVIFTHSSRFKPYLSKTNVNPSIRIVRCNQQSERQILFHQYLLGLTQQSFRS